MINEIIEKFVPEIEKLGFEWQDFFNETPDDPVFVFYIHFRRKGCPAKECININLRSKGHPNFSCELHRVDESDIWKCADVVRHQTDDYRAKEIGIHWWSLDRSLSRLSRDVDWLVSLVPQILAYIDHGEIGPNIRKWPEFTNAIHIDSNA